MGAPVTVEKFAIGQSVRRVEDARLLRGLGRYSDDVDLPRQAYAALVHSPFAHARIVGIDARAALKSPGVLAVLTGAALAADGVGNMPTDRTRKRRDGAPAFATPRPLLARERVRHVGDPVVLVVADTREHAVDAAERVAVKYTPLPAVAATAEARKPGAPAVWDAAPDNVAFVWSAGSSDAVTRAFESAPHVTRLDFVVSRVAVAPMEPRAAVGEFDRRTERYTLHTGIQGPHGTRTLLAATLGVEQNRVRVVSVDVGGSFGMRSGLYPEMALVLWAGKRLGRPVKWTSDRREGMLTDEAGRDNVSTVELALDRDGTFLALRIAVTLNVGAYLTPRSAGPGTNNVGGVAGMYRTPAIHHETTGVYTNTTPTGPYRGAGRPEATYAIERVIDVAARELGVDPIELRRRNLIPASAMPFKTGLVFTYDCGDFARGMDMALSLADHPGFARRRAQARDRGTLLGLGIANAIEVAGGPYTAVNPDTAQIRVNTDRGVTFAEVARAAYVPKQLPPGLEPGFGETAAFMPPSVTFPNGCHVCEVEIDEATGVVRIVRHTVVDDVGRIVNPMLVKGQIHGGVVQGLGQGLFETLVYDETGQLLAGSFMDYAMPRADDVPSFEVDSFEVPTKVNPLGAKGVGEAGTVGALPALMNAVNDALAPLGIRHLDMPVTAERVWRAIREAKVRA